MTVEVSATWNTWATPICGTVDIWFTIMVDDASLDQYWFVTFTEDR